MRTDSDLTKLVNQSGFPLQMAIDRFIQICSESIGWKVLYKEHGWKSSDGQYGFIDLVLENQWGSSVLVVECKRVLESDWIFLTDETSNKVKSDARLWVTNTPNHGRAYFGYYDLKIQPTSIETMFCVVAGQDSKSRPMLERVAAEVIVSAEALAMEELAIIQKRQYGLRMYASVIVTTARLILSKVNSPQTALNTGEVTGVTHEEVPWIRFRKQFSSDKALEIQDMDLSFSSVATAKEKLVFVVNASSLENFLLRWTVESPSLRNLM